MAKLPTQDELRSLLDYSPDTGRLVWCDLIRETLSLSLRIASLERRMNGCATCFAPISNQNTTGLCRSCSARRTAIDPAVIALRTENLRQRMVEDPAFRERWNQSLARNNKRAWEDPAKRVNMLAALHENRKLLYTPQAKEKWLASRAEAGRKRHETVMAWCPKEWRERYRYWRLSRKYLAVDAKAKVLAEISEKNRLLTPFERQMQAIRNGAGIIEVRPISREYDYTLGGVSSW